MILSYLCTNKWTDGLQISVGAPHVSVTCSRQGAVLPVGGCELVERQCVDSGSLLRLCDRLLCQDPAQPAGEILRMVRVLAASHISSQRGLPQPRGECQHSRLQACQVNREKEYVNHRMAVRLVWLNIIDVGLQGFKRNIIE